MYAHRYPLSPEFCMSVVAGFQRAQPGHAGVALTVAGTRLAGATVVSSLRPILSTEHHPDDKYSNPANEQKNHIPIPDIVQHRPLRIRGIIIDRHFSSDRKRFLKLANRKNPAREEPIRHRHPRTVVILAVNRIRITRLEHRDILLAIPHFPPRILPDTLGHVLTAIS